MPKLKYIQSNKKSKAENKQSEQVFRNSVKFIVIEMLIGIVSGIVWFNKPYIFIIIGIISFILVRLQKNKVETGFNRNVEYEVYILVGVMFGAVLASMISLVIFSISLLL